MKYFLLTLGCQMNKSDSERVKTALEQMGFSETLYEQQANLIGILACSVRQKSIDKVYSKIHQWNKAKNNRSVFTFISGCILPDDRKKFLRLFDLVFQMAELPQLPDMLAQAGVNMGIDNFHDPVEHVVTTPLKTENKYQTATLTSTVNLLPPSNIKPFWKIRPNYKSGFEAFVPIQNGCDKFCSFCAVPYTRGREVSRPSDEILQEIEYLVKNNYKSITLLGQNVNSYGKDKHGDEISFACLLEKIGKLGQNSGKEFWVYFTSPHPRDMESDVIKTVAHYPHLAKQFHVPLQSGDDKVLIRMNRNHSMAKYRSIISDIRKYAPTATIFTDIIVGFTGETQQQFNNTIKAFDEFKFNMAYIARYSPRPGATSFKWNDDVENDVKTKRLHSLTAQLKKHSQQYTNSLVGTVQRVLVTAYDPKSNSLKALTEGKINVRVNEQNKHLIGSFIDVEITATTGLSLSAQLREVFA